MITLMAIFGGSCGTDKSDEGDFYHDYSDGLRPRFRLKLWISLY
jgi:hypothetical protein